MIIIEAQLVIACNGVQMILTYYLRPLLDPKMFTVHIYLNFAMV